MDLSDADRARARAALEASRSGDAAPLVIDAPDCAEPDHAELWPSNADADGDGDPESTDARAMSRAANRTMSTKAPGAWAAVAWAVAAAGWAEEWAAVAEWAAAWARR
ncbi:hypothetical protein WU86_10225 [Corynebacterium xerosis]|nr:hypothetical protein [Corynebacterium xerosis]KKO80951.1 hypothetical protein WU86_10225 [Corynebacterium xerosis]